MIIADAAHSAYTGLENPFLADVRTRMQKRLRTSSADDMLAQLMGPAYDHPATTPKPINPSQGPLLIQPVDRPTQVKSVVVLHRSEYDESRTPETPLERYIQSVFASPVRGRHLDHLA